jgi:hypothetical protein
MAFSHFFIYYCTVHPSSGVHHVKKMHLWPLSCIQHIEWKCLKLNINQQTVTHMTKDTNIYCSNFEKASLLENHPSTNIMDMKWTRCTHLWKMHLNTFQTFRKTRPWCTSKYYITTHRFLLKRIFCVIFRMDKGSLVKSYFRAPKFVFVKKHLFMKLSMRT